MDNKNGKTILVAGCTSGIGLEYIEKQGRNQDNRIVMIGRNEEKLLDIQRHLQCESHCIVYDFEDINGIASIFDSIREWGMQFDSLIYCVGMDDTTPIKVVNEEKAQKMMNVNALAFLFLCKYFYSKRCSKDGATIVAISSLAALRQDEGMVLYSASKAALNSMIKTMSKEFIRRRIRVNGILPAGVDTPMAHLKSERMEGMSGNGVTQAQPYGLIPADNLVELMEFLSGDTSEYITGALIEVNAGMM